MIVNSPACGLMVRYRAAKRAGDHPFELPESIIHGAIHRSMVPVRRIIFCRSMTP